VRYWGRESLVRPAAVFPVGTHISLWTSLDSVLLAVNDVLNRKFAPLVDDRREVSAGEYVLGLSILITRTVIDTRRTFPNAVTLATRLALPISSPPLLADANVASNKTLRFIHRTRITQRVRQIGQYLAQHFLATPVLDTPMNGFVVGVVLRQHVPLRAGIENSQYRVEYHTRRDRFATRSIVGNTLLQKVLPDAFPLRVVQSNHALNFTLIALSNRF
jgi:hypothetical protein